MKLYKKFTLKTIALVAVLAISIPNTAYAMTYKDVPSTHWAYKAVDSVSGKGIMVGDLSANFNPDGLIDKFEASKILAKMAGYKYTDASSDEQLYYNRCYDNNISFINQYVSKFKKWNSNYNKEIAFLLDKKILTNDDLNQFVILTTENEERLRALSREETCVFLTRVMGKSNEAIATVPSNLFKDDASISAAYRPYVYYFRTLSIVGGDTNGNFNPKNAITKAAMAVVINGVLNISNPQAPAATVPTQTPAPAATATPNNNASSSANPSIETVQGTIAKLYAAARAMQVSSANINYDKKIYMVPTKTTITIDGAVKTFSDLTEGMSFTGVFSGNEIMSVSAVTAAASASTPAPNVATVQTPDQGTVIEGIVTATRSDASSLAIDIETKIVSPRGEIISTTTTYVCDKNITVLRVTEPTTFASIAKGDIVKISVNGSNVYKIVLEEKNVSLTATLVDKKYDEKTGVPTLTVTNADGKNMDFRIVVGSDITRKGSGQITWNELRVGDKVDIKAEYDAIKSIYGYGTKSTVDVWVKDIYISSLFSKITATDSNNNDKVYPLISGSIDPYTIKVGSKIKLQLDSAEVESFDVLTESKAGTWIGNIVSLTRSVITVRDDSLAYPISKDIKYNSETAVVDATTGKASSTSSLDVDMKIYIVLSETDSNYAKTITILSR